jgi:hypothetical protein
MHPLILQHAVGVDDEQPAQGNVLVFEVNAVAARNGPVLVAGQREVDLAEPALRARRADPPFVRLDGVGTDAQEVATAAATSSIRALRAVSSVGQMRGKSRG